MTRQRYQDWPERLVEFLQDANEEEFSWGAWDCALFACEAVLCITGEVSGSAFRGQYSDAAGAAQALHDHGGGDIESTATLFLGAPLGTVKKAQRGDVVLFESEEG